MSLHLRNGHLDNAKIKMQSAKLRNPDLVGMGVLVVASFSISRILYLLDIYYTPPERGRQVNFNHRFLGAASLRSAATKSEALSARTTADKNPKSETNPNHQNSKFKTNHNVLFRRRLWQPDSNIKQKKEEVEGL
jgi:hypothetical protein